MLQHRWSSLPDDIIAKIISHVDVPRPRGSRIRIFATTFKVNFFRNYPPDGFTFNISEFWKILDNLFTIFITPSINTFSIFLDRTLYEDPCVRPILDSWARRLRACNTQHIMIDSVHNPSGDRVCPPSVFQIQSLLSLHLSCAKSVSHPVVLPNLKELSLESVSPGFLGRLLSSCPSLEYLSFSLNDEPTGTNPLVSISSRTLKRLHITIYTWLVSGDIEVIIDAPTLDNLYFKVNSPLLSMRMIGSISNLKSIELISSVSMTMIYSNPSKTIFPFVTKLTLSVSSSKVFEQHMLPYYFPNLELLVLSFIGACDNTMPYNDWDIKGRFVLVEYVKHLEFRMGDVRLDKQTLNFLTWLLKSAPILEKLFISGYRGFCTRSNDDSLDQDQFYEILVKCAEDNSRCQIKLDYDNYY